jgi:hypothetical protein
MTTPKLTVAQGQQLCDALVDMARRLRPISVRGLYYQAVISAQLPFITKDKDGSRTYYRMVQDRVLKLRHTGELDWSWVVDTSRSDYGRPRWSDPAGFAETAPRYYRLDLWEDQGRRPLLMVEKAGQVPVFQGLADLWGVDVVACKGYGSATYLKDTAEQVMAWLETGQNVYLLVGADFDPSGCDWPRAAMAELEAHLRRAVGGDEDDRLDYLLACRGYGQVSMERILVTADDLTQLGAAVALRAPNPKDSRTAAWLSEHGFSADQETCVEMDALSPAVARERFRQRFQDLFDGDIEERQTLQQEHRDAITAALADLAGGEL